MNSVTFRTPPPKPDPLAIPGVVRIPLDEGTAAPFAGLGECFAVIGRASYPNAPGWCLLALPVPHNVATAACNVALGSHKAVKIKTQPAAAPATKTAAPTNTP
jgi:hypothetical protein